MSTAKSNLRVLNVGKETWRMSVEKSPLDFVFESFDMT